MNYFCSGISYPPFKSSSVKRIVTVFSVHMYSDYSCIESWIHVYFVLFICSVRFLDACWEPCCIFVPYPFLFIFIIILNSNIKGELISSIITSFHVSESANLVVAASWECRFPPFRLISFTRMNTCLACQLWMFPLRICEGAKSGCTLKIQ